jgi:hypothetical protein
MTEVIQIRDTECLVIETAGSVQVIELPSETIELLEVAEQGMPGPPGLKGDQGDQGAPGLSGASYPHIQAVPAADWVINHGLGRYPSVTVVDSAGSTVVGNVEYISANQVIVHFNGAFGGAAYLN